MFEDIRTKTIVVVYLSTLKTTYCARFQVQVLLLPITLKRRRAISEDPWINLQ